MSVVSFPLPVALPLFLSLSLFSRSTLPVAMCRCWKWVLTYQRASVRPRDQSRSFITEGVLQDMGAYVSHELRGVGVPTIWECLVLSRWFVARQVISRCSHATLTTLLTVLLTARDVTD